MKKNISTASKRRIPKKPGKTRCKYSFEVKGDIVVMSVDCRNSCNENDVRKDICWANLVRAISVSALPDKIILYGKHTLICDKILVTLLRNASLLIKRIVLRIEEIEKINHPESSDDLKRLIDLEKGILYDIPQLINRNFKQGFHNTIPINANSEMTIDDDFSLGQKILDGKHKIDFSAFSKTSLES